MANAGMPLPIICRNGQVKEQRVEGVPLGLLANTEYEEVSMQLNPGDTVVFSSDGIIDARDSFGQDYGRKRLARFVEQHCSSPAGELMQSIFQDVKNHAATAPAFDDQTLVVLKARVG